MENQIDQFLKAALTFSLDEVLQILKNAGVDVTCGACMEVAFTGTTFSTHTCLALAESNVTKEVQ
jgi:hypothetical protein